ncbi:MAG: tetratricopeptide repeat protein [Leptolyngbyaceae cyanobacterium SL_5_9]|nr:tetratricopeptide repeat protein [Leptolyngbyaceae cyanobacterium SL_5_9]NJO72859.1 tetratricopeptide repeat protein [Leptolyngbyaceae cyanobacterium RM1_406_9]
MLKLFQPIDPDRPLGGRYKVVSQLGAGGFGQTFLAEDLHLPGNPRCVVKQLQPQVKDPTSLQIARRLFDTEAQALYKLGNHDQIPRLLAHFEQDQEFYLAQELIEGEPLSEEMTGQPWSEGRVIALLRDTLTALAFVHQQNVIHRDIKPSNLMRRRSDGKIVLIDFGAVKQASTVLVNPETGPTQTISIGTHGYMPNEQLGGNPRFCSDVYALGKLAIQALTGVPPKLLHEDPHTCEIVWRDRAPHVSPDLADIIDKMVRYDFRARYPTANQALADVEQLPVPADESVVPPVQQAIAEVSLGTQSSQKAEVEAPLGTQSSQEADIPTATAPTLAADELLGKPAAAQPTESLLPRPVSRPASSPAPLPAVALAVPKALQSGIPSTVIHSILTRIQTLRPLPVVAGAGAVILIFLVGRTFTAPRAEQAVSNGSVPSAAAESPASPADPQAQVTALLTEGDRLRQANQYQPALDQYDQAIALNPDNAEAHWGRCYSLVYMQQIDSGITACDQALAIQPEYPEALWLKGYALDQKQQHTESLKLYEQAIALKPDFAQAWSNKGTALLLLGEPQQAIDAFDRATELDPDLAEAWNNRGAALWSLRRFDEAVNSIDRAIEIRPDYQDALSLREQMRQQLGR